MIDKSNEIFNMIATELRKTFPTINVIGESVFAPSKLPCCTIEEISNIPVKVDSSNSIKYARLQYRVQVFSNSVEGRRSEARAITSKVDEIFNSLGVFSKSYSTIPDVYNSSIYQITITYEMVMNKEGTIYRA